MKSKRILKLCAALAAAAMVLTVPVKASTPEGDRIIAQMEGTRAWIKQNSLTELYKARTEELRIATQFLGSVKDLAKVNPSFEAAVAAAQARLDYATVDAANATAAYEGRFLPDAPM